MTPATALIPQTPLARLKWVVRDGWTVAHRDLSHWAHQPGQIVAGLIFPIVFILLFGYVFGSGMIVPGNGDYIDFLMAGLFAQTMAFGIGETMVAVNTDRERNHGPVQVPADVTVRGRGRQEHRRHVELRDRPDGDGRLWSRGGLEVARGHRQRAAR